MKKTPIAKPKQISGKASVAVTHGPLLNALKKRTTKEAVSFHVPGHKMGQCVLDDFRSLIGEKALHFDYTELDGLDNLSCPVDVIAESQQLAANVFGADQTFYLINGTTVGIHAAILATCPPGSICLLPRNSHISAFNAISLAGCTPEYLKPEFDPDHNIYHGVTPEQIQQRLQNAKTCVGAVLIVSPSYFGTVVDVHGIADVCHSFGVPLVVDSAHGAHFGFHQAFPSAALSCGADIVIHSTHKTLTSLTQSSMLHIRSKLINQDTIAKRLAMLQSSSPSYLLLASLEASALQLSDPSIFDQPLHAVQLARERLNRIKGVNILSGAQKWKSVAALDPLRLCISVAGWNIDAKEVLTALDSQYRVVPELALNKLLVFIFGPGTVLDDAKKLVQAIERLSEKHCFGVSGGTEKEQPIDFGIPPSRLLPSVALTSQTQKVLLKDSALRISAEAIGVYPPGIPLILPGEEITPLLLQEILRLRTQNVFFTGPSDKELETIHVIK